ncbi:MAG: VOC family protein [Bacteroidales bacterium]|nr:VOC family protein [Bacteroidales bacterium]MCM1414485.1 VOC family protein [bacterium]MCM1423747.1 VOC family protein [bacterium]
MPTYKIHHIGYLVKKIEKAQKTFSALGYQAESEVVYDPIRDVRICFLEKDGYRIELVSPASENSVVAGLLKKYKNCPYHICYEAADYESACAALSAAGFLAIDTPTEAPALERRKVAFFSSPAVGMIELLLP